jgi:hypothetical protein
VITATPDGHTVQRQPLLAIDLHLADYEAPMEDMLKPYPFGLVGAGSAYQDVVHHLFIDHVERDHIDDLYVIHLPEASQPAPMVNMVSIRQLSNDSLHSILEESLDEYSQGSTKMISTCLLFC